MISREHAQALANGTATISTFEAIVEATGSFYAMRPTQLQLAYVMAMRATDPILEFGAGLSTIVIGIAARRTANTVISVDDSAEHAKATQDVLDSLDLFNVGLNVTGLDKRTGFYDLPGLPQHLGMIVHDGFLTYEARARGLPVIKDLAKHATVLIDDVGIGPTYGDDIAALATELGHGFVIVPTAPSFAILVPRVTQKETRT